MRIGILIVGLVACGGSDPSPVIDGAMGSAGLSFSWQSTLPGPISATVEVTSATLSVQTFHAISDAGNTATIDDTVLVWDAKTRPGTLAIADAAPGLYSRLSFKLDGENTDDAYRILGTVQISGTAMPFRIHDRNTAVSYALDVATTLAPGGAAEIGLALDLSGAIDGLDFATLRDDDGTLDLDGDDAQIAAFRARLASAFTIRD